MVLTTNLKKRILFYKKLRELFKNGHLFLSIFQKRDQMFIWFFFEKWVLPENPVNTKKIIFICY